MLTVHGFTGTPYEMRDLAVLLAEQGHRVTNVKLPGHAEDETALAATRWPDWWDAVRQAYTDLARTCDRVYVCGLSMGGILGLHLAAHYPVAGAAIYATPMFLDDPKLKFVPLLKYIRPIQPKGDSDIREPEARAAHPNCGGTPLACVESLLHMMRHVDEDLPEVRCPLLLIYSRGDETVPYRNLAHVAARVASPDVTRLTVEHSGHVVTVDLDKQQVFDTTLEFLRRVQS